MKMRRIYCLEFLIELGLLLLRRLVNAQMPHFHSGGDPHALEEDPPWKTNVSHNMGFNNNTWWMRESRSETRYKGLGISSAWLLLKHSFGKRWIMLMNMKRRKKSILHKLPANRLFELSTINYPCKKKDGWAWSWAWSKLESFEVWKKYSTVRTS